MLQFIGAEYPEDQRLEILKDNCDAVEITGYTRRFTPDELLQKKEELAEISIQINDVEEEKANAMAEFKAQLKPLNEQKTSLLTQLKKKSEFVEDECYKFIDNEDRMVGYYDKAGTLVSSRAIMPQEMQKTIYSELRKTGN